MTRVALLACGAIAALVATVVLHLAVGRLEMAARIFVLGGLPLWFIFVLFGVKEFAFGPSQLQAGLEQKFADRARTYGCDEHPVLQPAAFPTRTSATQSQSVRFGATVAVVVCFVAAIGAVGGFILSEKFVAAGVISAAGCCGLTAGVLVRSFS